jgi:uncharacterized membrane protein YfcA
MDWHTISYAYSVSGFCVGMLVGLTGVGGGSLMTPVLVLFFGISPGTAVGTDLLYAAITKSGGTLIHSWNRTIEWRIVGRLAAGSVPATILSLLWLDHIGTQSDGAHSVITNMLGFALILTALTLVFRKWLLAYLARITSELSNLQRKILTVILGAFLGVLVSISSVGAGAIGITVLIALYPTLRPARIVGSDIVHAVPLTFIAGLGHWYLGLVDWGLLNSLLIGSLPGITIGSLLAARASDRILRPLLAGTLAVVALRWAF